MRRSYVLAIAVISVYCLTDAFASSGGEPAERSGKLVFSAEIVDAPILGNLENGAVSAAPSASALGSPEGANVAADPVAEAEKPAVSPLPAVSAPKVRAAAVAPRRTSPVAKPYAMAPSPQPAMAYSAPSWQPAIQPVAVAHNGPGASGCSGARWSQPDAAGVPVLLCN